MQILRFDSAQRRKALLRASNLCLGCLTGGFLWAGMEVKELSKLSQRTGAMGREATQLFRAGSGGLVGKQHPRVKFRSTTCTPSDSKTSCPGEDSCGLEFCPRTMQHEVDLRTLAIAVIDEMLGCLIRAGAASHFPPDQHGFCILARATVLLSSLFQCSSRLCRDIPEP